MITSSDSLFQRSENGCDTIIASIDGHLNVLHDLLHKAFSGGVDKPTGLNLIKAQVFDRLWSNMGSAQHIKFESMEDLDKFYAIHIKNLENHIQDACDDFYQQRSLISSYKTSLLKTIIEVYQELLRYRFTLQAFRENTPEKFADTLTAFMKACQRIENELMFVDSSEIKNSIDTLTSFLAISVDELRKKRYSNRAASDLQVSATTPSPDELIFFKLALEGLPSISELNADIEKFTSAPDKSDAKENARSMLKNRIQVLERSVISFEEVTRTLKQCKTTLNRVTTIEDKAKPFQDMLRKITDVSQVYKDALLLAGMDADSCAQGHTYAHMNKVFQSAIEECARQSTAETITVGLYSYGWNQVGSQLNAIQVDLIKRMTDMTQPYLANAEKLKKLLKKMHEVNDRERAVNHDRTQLAALIAKSGAILTESESKLRETIVTLNEHVESTLIYLGRVVRRHVGGMFVGASAGSGVTTAASYLVMTQPPLMAMAGIGGIIGTAAGIAAGMVREDIFPRNNEHKIKLIDDVKPSSEHMLAQKPARRWISPVTFFSASPHSEPAKESVTMVQRKSNK